MNTGDLELASGCEVESGGVPTTLSQGDNPSFAWVSMADITGVSFLRSTIRFSDIRDGSSCTYLVGEKYVRPDYYDTGQDPGDNEGVYMGFANNVSRGDPRGPFPRYARISALLHLRLSPLGVVPHGDVRRLGSPDQLQHLPADPSAPGQPGRRLYDRREGVLTLLVFAHVLPVGIHQRGVNDVLGDKPDLRLVGADHVADQQVVRAVVAFLGRIFGHLAGFDQQDFVRLQQPRNLHGHFLAPLGGRGILVASATSADIATLMPPSIMIRSAI